MTDKEIFQTLHSAGLTVEGACGLMGNMKAESGMKANIAQRGMTTKSDDEYTAAADNGFIDFANDSVGYGLCQWTYHTRKAALLAFCRSHGASVGDAYAQVQFCLQELNTYPGVNSVLRSSHDLKQCSDIVCTQFERPAVNNLDARYQFSKGFYDQFASETATPAYSTPTYNTTPSYPQQSYKPPAYTPTTTPTTQQKQETNAKTGISFSSVFSGLWETLTGTRKAPKANAAMPVLQEGDVGAGVAAIQVALKYHKMDLGSEGTLGIWEAGTTMGVRSFQQQNGIPVTGKVDGQTWGKLMT